MANNWVKDGLDAYLSLTGAHQAERKAEDDRRFQQHGMDVQDQQLQITKAAAGLTNQVTQQQINKGTREEEDAAKWDNLLLDEAYKKEVANPFTPTAKTINDPAKIEMSKSVYGNTLKTAAFLRDELPKLLPEGASRVAVPMARLSDLTPSYVQETAKFMFAPAAAKRGGQVTIDPVTGARGILTGNMGHILLERDPSGETFISGDMEVKNDDGSIRFAPFTNGTDDPNQMVKRMPISAMEHEANAVFAGIEDAQRTGADPAATITRRKFAGMENWPKELKKKIYENMIDLEKNLQTRESEVETTKKVGKTLESMRGQIDALPWEKDPHTAAADLYTTLSQSGMTTSEVEKAVTRIVAARVPAEKNLQIEEIGAGGNNAQKAIVGKDGTVTPLGKTYQKHQTPAPTTDKESSTGLKAREALSSIDKDIKELHVDNRGLRKEIRDADDKGKAEIQASINANSARMEELQAEKSRLLGRKTPAAKDMEDAGGEHSRNVSGAKQMFSGQGGAKPAYLKGFDSSLLPPQL